MPTILESLIPRYASDSVAVFNQDFEQIFPRARILKATVKEEAKVMEHPVESGAIITDHRIILPIEIELSLMLQAADYQDTYRAIRQYYFNATLLIVQTKAGIYDNQLISSMPHEEDPEQFDAITLALKFKQVQFARAVFGIVPRNPTNRNTVNRGTQQATVANAGKASAATGIFDSGSRFVRSFF